MLKQVYTIIPQVLVFLGLYLFFILHYLIGTLLVVLGGVLSTHWLYNRFKSKTTRSQTEY